MVNSVAQRTGDLLPQAGRDRRTAPAGQRTLPGLAAMTIAARPASATMRRTKLSATHYVEADILMQN
jgi:hypothetical protein